jgi:hypothetical protein
LRLTTVTADEEPNPALSRFGSRICIARSGAA